MSITVGFKSASNLYNKMIPYDFLISCNHFKKCDFSQFPYYVTQRHLNLDLIVSCLRRLRVEREYKSRWKRGERIFVGLIDKERWREREMGRWKRRGTLVGCEQRKKRWDLGVMKKGGSRWERESGRSWSIEIRIVLWHGPDLSYINLNASCPIGMHITRYFFHHTVAGDCSKVNER